MKKAILITAGIAISALASAQKVNIQNASNSLRDKDYPKAIEYINKAVADPDTKDNPKAWFVRGNIYMSMQNEPAKKAENPYREAAASYKKVAELDAKYEKDAVTQMLLISAYNYYNDAAVLYNKKKYTESYDLSKAVVDIHAIEGGKRFNNKSFDTIATDAMVIQAFSAYYDKKYDDALPILLKLKDNPINKGANTYLVLSDIYKTTGKDNQMLAIIEEGKKLYPDNQSLRNEELNYYIKSGKQDILMRKLEDAVAKDPNNGELLFNLANGYNNMAFPKDADGKELAKPANYAELLGKAEDAYKRAITADANNAGYNYNLGVLYYNQATEYNKRMNEQADLSNSAKGADKKKYEEAYNKIMVERDAAFDKAIPNLTKTVELLEPTASSLSADDKFSYQSALMALKEIYARKNDMAKSGEYKAKLEALRGKK